MDKYTYVHRYCNVKWLEKIQITSGALEVLNNTLKDLENQAGFQNYLKELHKTTNIEHFRDILSEGRAASLFRDKNYNVTLYPFYKPQASGIDFKVELENHPLFVEVKRIRDPHFGKRHHEIKTQIVKQINQIPSCCGFDLCFEERLTDYNCISLIVEHIKGTMRFLERSNNSQDNGINRFSIKLGETILCELILSKVSNEPMSESPFFYRGDLYNRCSLHGKEKQHRIFYDIIIESYRQLVDGKLNMFLFYVTGEGYVPYHLERAVFGTDGVFRSRDCPGFPFPTSGFSKLSGVVFYNDWITLNGLPEGSEKRVFVNPNADCKVDAQLKSLLEQL